jgi:hypothetical protein
MSYLKWNTSYTQKVLNDELQLTSSLEAKPHKVHHAPKPVKAHRLVAKKLKDSDQFSHNILKKNTVIIKNKKDKARKSKKRKHEYLK